MPLRINGHELPWSAVTGACIAIFWLAGLSFQVKANGDEIKKQEATKERLVRIETTQESVKKTQSEIKEEQAENRKILIKILEKVSANNEGPD